MANRFWVNTGSTTNWDATVPTNWAATSGSTTKVAVPGSGDDVTFDGAGNGNSASVVSANITILSLTFTAGYTNTVTINTARTLTIAGNFTDNTAHSWTVSGTGSMAISAASTITSGGKTFPGPVTFSGVGTTKTLSGNWSISGLLTIGSTGTINATTSETLTCSGITVSNNLSTGTAKIVLSGGIWSGAGTLYNDLDIAGNVTVSGGVFFGSSHILTYVSGTVTTTSSTLQVQVTGVTLNTAGISWNNVTLGSTSITYTINSLLTITGTLTFPNTTNVTFAGTSGWTAGTISNPSTGATTVTLKNGIIYTITTAFNAFNSRTGGILVFTSDDGTLTATLILNREATCNVLASFTRINATGGRPIITFNGVLTTTTNIVVQTNVAINPPKYSRKFGRRKSIYNRPLQVQYVSVGDE